MKRATYTDKMGRRTWVWLPEKAPDADARMGIPIGPPPLDALGLPAATEVRLHNELYARGLLTIDDVKKDRQSVVGALMAAFKVDAEAIVTCYTSKGEETK